MASQELLDGIAITDHDTLKGYYQTINLLQHQSDFFIIPGIEILLREGHMIVLGVHEEPRKPLLSTYDLNDYAREQGGIIVIPHPYRPDGLGERAETCPTDAVEVLNPRATNNENWRAKLLAEARGLCKVAGSDAHRMENLGIAYTELESDRKVENVLKAIKAAKSRVYGSQ